MLQKSFSAFIGLTILASCATGPQATRGASDLAALSIQPCALPDIAAPRKIAKPQGTAWWAPNAPEYPYPAKQVDRAALEAYATCHSEALTAYINAWAEGRAPARLPDALVPWGTSREYFSYFTLRDPDEMTAEEQWAIREAHTIDENALWGSFPDPNATYIVAPAVIAPFGSQLIVEGDFPYARYFSAQITPPFNLDTYHYETATGVGEVPIVDADITPVRGSVNPFRVGADRMASNRRYRIAFDLARGDGVALNRAFRPPHFREASNTRVGGALQFQGPWGHPQSGGHKRGLFEPGALWLRYYAPDSGRGPLAGVALPKMAYELPNGRRFFIQPDLDGFLDIVQRRTALGRDRSAEPNPRALATQEYGWLKQAGIFESVVGGIALGTGGGSREYVNDLVRGVGGRGDGLAPPNDYEQSATSATHIDYLVRSMSLERDHVVVLTGRMPTFPDTRDGATRMQRAQMRYWSITGYHVPSGTEFISALTGGQPAGLAVQSVMDDEVVLDGNRDYVIVLSRDGERPDNARPEAGVTWVDWGPSGEVNWTLRWMSVGPEWKAPFAPTPAHIGSRSDYWSRSFDPNATFRNDHAGALGRYQPRVHYMSRAEFEALGSRVRATDVPVWR